METFLITYRQGNELVFDIYESNHDIKGLPSIIIYADDNFHVKIPYLLREIGYITEPSELKLTTDFIFVMRHQLYDNTERDTILQQISKDLNRFDYTVITPKDNK